MPLIRKDNLTPVQKALARRLYASGMGVSAVALAVAKSRTAVIKYLGDIGIYRVTKRQLSIETLTPPQIRTLRTLHERGVSYREIALRMGFTDWQQARNAIRRLGLLRHRHAVLHHRGKRRCHECLRTKNAGAFAGSAYLCRDCRWFYHARIRFGLLRPELEAMVERQDGLCAVCVRRCDQRSHLCIDHVKHTKRVRGLLCTRCNTALGLFGHDPVRLESAAWYLRQPQIPRGSDLRALLAAQRHRCAICFGLPRHRGWSLARDHDHRTKKFRGFLCENCNRALGLLRDDVAAHERAATYLT